ncbi:MAG: radical SAM protein [Holophaga sp.]
MPKKLVLVALHLEASARAVPLGPAMLASVLKRAFPVQVETRIVDLLLQQSAEACAEDILASSPDWVGFSVYVWNRALAKEIARILRRRKPSILLMAGGSEATADPEGILCEGFLDLVLPGEGEELIVEVVGKLLQGGLPAEFRDTLQPAPVKDLATLPSPYLEGSLDPAAYAGMLWELSRGCPFRCDFCFESRGTEGTRRVPMERVKEELKLFEACKVSQVFVLDPTFNFDKRQAKEILRLIAAEAPAIHFFFEIRSEFIDKELAKLFAAVRCTLQIGMQSAHDAVLRKINRSMDLADFEAKVLLLHQAGATYGFDLIYGLPGDSFQGFQASVDFALSLAPNHVDIFPLSVLPGTRLHETAPELGLQHLQGIPYTVIAAPGFSAADMHAAARLAQACDVMYNQGKAVPWFGLVLGWLDWAPTELFGRFADFLDTHADPDITALQAAFLHSCFGEPKQAEVVADMVTYFGYSGALIEAAARAPEASVPLAWLRGQTRLATFHHDPQALVAQLQAGITELEDLACVLPSTPCEALLHVVDGETLLRIVTTAEGQAYRMFQEDFEHTQEEVAQFLQTVVFSGEA